MTVILDSDFKWIIVWLCTLYLLGCSSPSPGTSSTTAQTQASTVSTEPDVIPVEVMPVKLESMSSFLRGTATIESDDEIRILAEAAGRTTQVAVEEGDLVEQHHVLAQLDDREAQLRVERAKVQLAEAKTAYTSLVRLDQQEAELSLRGAKVAAVEARENYRRAENMAKAGLISQEELDAKQTQRETAEVAMQKEEVRLQYKTIDDARYRYERAQTELKEAELQLQFTTVKAPITGVVSARQVARGQFVQKNQHLFTVVDPTRLLARTFLPEKFSSQVTIGQDTYVETEALQAERFAARVKLISPVVEAESGTFKVTVELLNPPPTLKPGMFATVLITVATRDQTLVIPKRALTLDSSRPTVYRLEKGRARRVPLKVGLSDNDRIEVLSGLTEGDRIIVVGQEKLLDEMRVKVVGDEPKG
ncbi:efflux RND transporter periplasmic adaptor subunit [Candidatus Entotheonella palauensis]|uniref:efflux RND transporter periplasmic adaptor subunit n=1 Tax=Candidatus Entotheonella palauensis TaxID=93172 RepID=UPI0015C4A78B|nr:efflux RND transporter periplasmic adaptor subunit [Candidatus Entotheonella palauensis]